MSEWSEFVEEVSSSFGGEIPFFRGHSNSQWQLLSGLGRKSHFDSLESVLYYDFVSLGGNLLEKRPDPWDVLFAMQHHGLPTRLLDWTTTFASALYFALRPFLRDGSVYDDENAVHSQPCVWVLNPFELNHQKGFGAPVVLNPYCDLENNYYQYFIEQSKAFGYEALAIAPPQYSPRQSAQRSVFTLHADPKMPLEEMAKGVVRKFDIPMGSLIDAATFLSLAGINEFSIFPDLDGLARHLCTEHLPSD